MNHVVYLISGSAHLPYLVVSIDSLRRHGFTDDITVYVWPESLEIAAQIERDKSLGVKVIPRAPQYRGKNAQFIDKIRLAISIDRPTVYLDADTMPVAELNQMFRTARRGLFVATQFCDWVSSTGIPRKRVSQLIGRQVDQDAVESCLKFPMFSPNGGVFAFSEGCRDLLKLWESWTEKNLDMFIADEVVLHVVLAQSIGRSAVCYPGVWNCSPKHGLKLSQEPKIWHFHGDSNVRPSKSQHGYDLWWPRFLDCLANNKGNLEQWVSDCGNSYVNDLLGKV